MAAWLLFANDCGGHFTLHSGRCMATRAKPVDMSYDTAKLGAM